jgi:hypothetical protein
MQMFSALLLLVLAESGPAAEQTERTRAFECTRPITGKRDDGIEVIRFEYASQSARLTLTFKAARDQCSFRAEWRYPEAPIKGIQRLVTDQRKAC